MYNTSSSKGNFNFITKLIILYYATSPFLYLVRTLSGDSGVSYLILRLSEPILLITTLAFCILQRHIKLNAYVVTFFFISFYGLFVAVLQENSKVDLLGGYFHFMTGLVLFLYFSNTGANLDLEKVMKVLSFTTLSCCSLVIGFMYCMPYVLGFRIYLGLACQVLIMVFFYHLQKRQLFRCLISIILIILSGKRGVFVALFLGFIISVTFQLHKTKFKNILMVFIVGLMLSGIVINVLPIANEQLIKKYSFSENNTVDDYSAGRWNEISSAYEAWKTTTENMILGSGFGFTYTYIHSAKKIADVEDYKNVHFSYLNPLIIFGIPVAIVYYICLAILFLNLFYNVETSLQYLKWASLAYLIYACFVFDLFDEPIFWMINGILLSYRRFVAGPEQTFEMAS